jgi:hypothetical protein
VLVYLGAVPVSSISSEADPVYLAVVLVYLGAVLVSSVSSELILYV